MSPLRGAVLRESEAGFQRAIQDLAALYGWSFYHTRDSRGSQAGFPDIVLARPSDAVIFAEVKNAKGKLTLEQQHWQEVLHACPGVECYIWRPGDWQEIVARLQRRRA